METTEAKLWTTEELADLFMAAHDRADDETREATKGPFNPFGDKFESTVWYGTIEEAREERGWPHVDEDDSEPKVLAEAGLVVGTGRPIFVSFTDGQFPCVFCESAIPETVEAVVNEHYFGDEWDSI